MSGKVYFITGGNRGIGFGLAEQFYKREPDSTIIVSTRDLSRSKALSQLASESNGRVKIVILDVSDEDSINKLDAQLLEAAPDGIDTFISNAGIAEDISFSPVLSVPREVWYKHYTTNVIGPILLSQVVYKHLEKKPTKQLIFISSSAGSIGEGFFPISTSAYGQSKAALNYSIRGLSHELASQGYTVVSIHPGAVKTDMGNVGKVLLTTNHPEVFGDGEAFFIELDESVTKLADLFQKLTPADTGKFLSYDGTTASW